jgi:hypothetical protein
MLDELIARVEGDIPEPDQIRAGVLRKSSAVGVGVHDQGLAEVTELGGALDLNGLRPGSREGWEKDGDQDGDDADDDEQLDESEGAAFHEGLQGVDLLMLGHGIERPEKINN